MKSKLVTLATLAFAAGSAFATVSLNFNAEFDTGVPQNLSNAAGVPTNGMQWGVIVDKTGNGLSASAYDAVTLVGGQSYVLTVSSAVSDDVLYMATGLTADTTGSIEGDGVTTGGNGGIYDINGLALANGVATGQKFYVVWFSGQLGGTLTDASFTIPADGALLSYGNPFVGADPIRTAGFAYDGVSATPTGAGISFVPEPSAALLGAIGALGLLRRRRD